MPFSEASNTRLISLLEPVPDPTITPVSLFAISSLSKPESFIASSAATKLYADVSLINLPIFLSISSIENFIFPETWHLIPLSLYSWFNSSPDLAFKRASKISFCPLPRQDIIPIPVMTTLFMLLNYFLKNFPLILRYLV